MARLTVNLVYRIAYLGRFFFSTLAAALVPRFLKRAIAGQSHLLALSRSRSLPASAPVPVPGYHATQVPIYPSGKSRFAPTIFSFSDIEQGGRTLKNGTLLLCKHASESRGTLICGVCLHMGTFLGSSTPFSRPLSIIGNQPKPCR